MQQTKGKDTKMETYPCLLFLDVEGNKLDKTWILRTYGPDVLLFKRAEEPCAAS